MVSPTKRSGRVPMAPAYQRSNRKVRRPQHTFNLKFRPYQIQPFCLAPVLPGESLKSAMIQAQIWSDPLAASMKNNGWWLECFLFYVKHRDLGAYEIAADGLGKDLIDMFVSNEDMSIWNSPSKVAVTYTPKGGIDFASACNTRVVEEFFRDEGETAGSALLNGVFAAQIRGRGQGDAFEHLTLASAYQDRRQKLDVDNDGTIYVDEVEKAYMEWAAAHDAGLVDMDYEDWMRTYGGTTGFTTTPDRVDLHRPELLGHVREFTYPTNTVEPTTGIPATAVGWRIGSRLGKAFYFPEPGWIFGVVVVRPKVYLGNQEGSVACMMNTRNAWLPAVLNDQMTVSHMLIDDLTGPLETTMTEDYWIDLRDLLNYGDQFINYTPGATDAMFVALPLATQRRYANSADVDQLFKDTTAGTGKFDGDGVLSLNILGRQQERYENLVLGKA